MSTEILRIEGVSIGLFDSRNYYTANIQIAGKGSKDEGKERLEKMTFYPVLHSAIWNAVNRVTKTDNIKNLKAWATMIENLQLNLTHAIDSATERLVKVAPKLTRDGD